jgi:adenylate kinase family enzyme
MVCPECGGALTVRGDDTPEIIRQRLQEQGNAAVAPVANYFAERGRLARIDARLPIAEVEHNIRVAIES